MTDGDALLAAVVDNPDEDTPRLAYADWLDEFATCDADTARAEFIKKQVAAPHTSSEGLIHGRQYPKPDFGFNLLVKYGKVWITNEILHLLRDIEPTANDSHFGWGGGGVTNLAYRFFTNYGWEWRRGFIYRVELGQRAFPRGVGALFASHPITEGVTEHVVIPVNPRNHAEWSVTVDQTGLFKALRDGTVIRPIGYGRLNPNSDCMRVWFVSEEEANMAVQLAYIAWGRELGKEYRESKCQ